jgi:ankyrin repeat protein
MHFFIYVIFYGGSTALFIAARFGFFKIVKLLVELNADMNEYSNKIKFFLLYNNYFNLFNN